MTVGIIGVGAMGGAMAKVLLAAGFPVRGCDPSLTAQRVLRASGGEIAKAPGDLAGCDPIIVMTVDADQAEAALFTDNAVARFSGALVMLTLTMPPSRVVDLARKISTAGCAVLDAPVTGGASGAAAGTLVFMAAGDNSACARAAPVMEALGKAVYRFGDAPGGGATAKMINQLVAGCNLAVAAEAMALGSRVGLPANDLFDLLSSGAASSWMLADRGHRMLSGEFSPPKSAVDIFIKDLEIVLHGGRQHDFHLPMCACAYNQFSEAAEASFGRKDDASLFAFFQQRGESHNENSSS